MMFREANNSDIKQIQFVRHAVNENRLSDPSLVPDADVAEYINKRGKGWVCVVHSEIAGFAIVDLIDNNIWALFVHPDFEGNGIGKKLHGLMLNWYFENTKDKIWLGTEPGTRAEKFYRMQGWKEAGLHGKGELKFEMQKTDWQKALP
ncbi:MAG TPA: GNAT family N-acetyltransferase [Ferruginibacter sp.]|nr:GNAT family N-acetyltransferase [Ferruginibacter sp.]